MVVCIEDTVDEGRRIRFGDYYYYCTVGVHSLANRYGTYAGPDGISETNGMTPIGFGRLESRLNKN